MSEKFIDPVVEEVHATRARMLEAAGGDIQVLMQQVAERQRQSNRKIVRLAPRKPVETCGRTADDESNS